MPRTRSIAWAQLKVGLLAIAALALAALLIFLVGGQGGFPWQQYRLKTRFANVMGLKSGAIVRVAGVQVGKVDYVEFAGAEVEVGLVINEAMQGRITTDSRATIGSLSLLGEPVIDVSPASTGTPLQDGAMIPSGRTPGQLADVAEGARQGLEEATKLVADIRAGKGTVGKLFTDEALYREINAFVSAAEDVTAALNSNRGTLGRLINDPKAGAALEASLEHMREITGRISRGEGSLGRLMADPAFAQSLQGTTANLEAVTAQIRRGEGTLGKLVTDEALYTRLDSLSARLDAAARQLSEGEGTAGRLLRDKQLYENMNGTVNEVRALVGDIRRDPKKYLNVKVSLF